MRCERPGEVGGVIGGGLVHVGAGVVFYHVLLLVLVLGSLDQMRLFPLAVLSADER